MAIKDMTKHELQSVVRGLENQITGSRVVAIEYLKAIIAEMPDPPHRCECPECAERGNSLLEWRRLYNDLKDCLPPGFVITLCGRTIDHTQINNAISRLDAFVRGR